MKRFKKGDIVIYKTHGDEYLVKIIEIIKISPAKGFASKDEKFYNIIVIKPLYTSGPLALSNEYKCIVTIKELFPYCTIKDKLRLIKKKELI